MQKKNKIILLAGILVFVIGISTVFYFLPDRILSNIADNKKLVDKNKFLDKKFKIKELQKYFHDIKTKFGDVEPNYPVNYLMTELIKAKKTSFKLKSSDIEWIQRGPGNVGGRTRTIIVDADDPSHNTWIAGSATGGAWKTTNAGISWELISDDIPYLATTTLAVSNSNTHVIYMGTGESFPGSMQTTGGGIFKSIDKGESWEQLSYTASNEDFRYINGIIVDPDNADIILVATNTGIFKSIDGGISWVKKYSSNNPVEDITADTSYFSTQFAGENSVGILRSIDNGETWELVNNGIGAGFTRFEIAISPTNHQKVYCSASKFDNGSAVFASRNNGLSWNLLADDAAENYDILGGQGDYDNTIAVNPYNENSIFVGGVNLWKIGISSTTRKGSVGIKKFDTINTSGFFNFVPFIGNILPGMNTGDKESGTNLIDSDFVSIEIRFGPGIMQKAHRFTVPSEATSGVLASQYTYEDYVDVPFQVWDITNNRQLMCSFRDQERDGVFNLYERTGDAYGELGREYLFINSVTYNNSAPNSNIATQGGRSYKLIYFFWPTLMDKGSWMPNNLLDSKIYVESFFFNEQLCTIKNISDAYNKYSGKNIYDQENGLGRKSIPGFHPDHHALVMVPIDPLLKKFWIINGNDGGLGISYDNGVTFNQIKNGFVTTQFYGVAKKPFRNEYIGGMQDNGTWQSPANKNAMSNSEYTFQLGGDGFEAVWNRADSNKILGSSYNNTIYKSLDHGRTWEYVNNGIGEDGPFITKLTGLSSDANKVFAVGTEGLYYTTNFARTSWKKIIIGEGWLPDGYIVTSQHHVENSIANDSIIWAGAALNSENGWNMFVSIDQGFNFSAVKNPTFEMPAFISGIATHPTEPETAFLLYSIYGDPKILRTNDLGLTWEDITGFNEKDSSNNGFPDVGCLSLFVFPDNPARIWAGTEIGIIESLNNGETWQYLESSLPAVPIWQIFMQDNQIVVSTYGRGIWTYQYGKELFPSHIIENKQNENTLYKIFPNPTSGQLILKNTSGESERVNISIYNSSGKIVYSALNINSADATEINLSHVNSGTYFVTIFNDTEIYTSKIIILH